MIGSTISHYKIIEKIGEGGMGVVYKAEDLKLHRLVAIKVFSSILSASPDDRARFFQEARLASQLNHPNIVTIHEFDEVDGTAFIVSEYVEGKPLNTILQQGLLSTDRVLEVAMQIAGGISDAHAHGIVHRDIKPENVMVPSQGQVKVMDFGLARVMGSSHVTTPGSLIGTFAYMSPEQINEEEVDARSDIFSFGTLLYQMVAGELPFRGKTVAELLTSITRKHPDSLKKFRPEISGELVRIVLKALSKDRHRRYQSMNDLIADLEHLRSNPTMRRKIDRSMITPGIIIGSVIVVLLVTVAAILYFRDGNKTSGSEQKSVAVLPFQNVLQDSSLNFLSIGFADEIITRLSYVRALLVRPTSSVVPYEGKAVQATVAGKALGADYVLEGRFQKLNDRLNITIQFVDVQNGSILVGEKMDFFWHEMSIVQDNVSEKIIDALRIHLSAKESRALYKVNSDNNLAYESYLRGIAYADKSSMQNNQRAIEMFERAVDLDTMFTEAYARLSEVYVEQFWSNYSPDTAWVGRGIKAAQRAIALDPQSAIAHANLGFGLRVRGDYPGGILQSLRALQIDPHNSASLEDLGVFYQYIGNFDKAKEIFSRAAEGDPSFNVDRARARLLQFQGKYRESIFELQRAIQRNPDDAWLRAGLLALSHIRLNDLALAEEAINRAELSEPTSPQIHLSRAMLETAREDYKKAEQELTAIKRFSERDYAIARQVAAIYAKQGDKEKAIAWMEKAGRLGNYWYSWYENDSWFDAIRDDKRFVDMMSKMKSTLDSVAVSAQSFGY